MEINSCPTAIAIDGRIKKFEYGDTIVTSRAKYIPLNCGRNFKEIEYYPDGILLAEKFHTTFIKRDTANLYDLNTSKFNTVIHDVIYKGSPCKEWIYYHKDGNVWKKINFDLD